jgi:hypothetical protein
MVDSGCRGEQMERKGGGELQHARSRTRARTQTHTHTHMHTYTRTHARTHTISHIGGRIQVYAENSSRGNGLVARPCARASSIYAHKDRRGEQ